MEEGWQKEVERKKRERRCYSCNSNDNTTCACAKQRWIREQELQKTPDGLWEQHKRDYSVGVCAICPKCGGSSMSFCACAKESFLNKSKNPFQY